MGTQYNGISGNITLPGLLTVSSMSGSGTNPTLVTFTGAHGLTTGDRIDLYDIDGNTAANGEWSVTVTSGVQISIPVTGNGTYTGLFPGVGRPLTFGSTFQIPSDGDLISGSNNNVAPEALADRTAFLYTTAGFYKIVQQVVQGANDPTIAVTWGTISSSTTSWTAGTSLATLISLHSGDIVELSLTTAAALVSAGMVTVSFGAAMFAPGAVGTFSKVIWSGQPLFQPNISAMNLRALYNVPSTGNGTFCIGHEASVATSSVSSFGGDHMFVARVWRPTGLSLE